MGNRGSTLRGFINYIVPKPPWTQADFDVRFDWGAAGVRAVEIGTVVVIVDVLRFTTAVEAATSRGAAVCPSGWRDESANEFARSIGAHLADGSDPGGYSLSPVSLLSLGPSDNVVLPSANGSTCALIASKKVATVLAGCLRNAAAVSECLRETKKPVTVIACGEQWPNGALRPCIEDLLGAGAILPELGGQLSPEARAAVWTWRGARNDVTSLINQCVSGTELRESGYAEDVNYAADVNVSRVVAMLTLGAFRSV